MLQASLTHWIVGKKCYDVFLETFENFSHLGAYISVDTDVLWNVQK